jgi:hypothetical protein
MAAGEQEMDHSVFEHLALLNRNVDAAVDTLQKLAEYPELQDEGFTVRQAYLRECQASVNVSVLDAMEESEQAAIGSAYRERRGYEKKTRDPDDCYLDVLHREEERRQQGLPSLIGIQHGMRRATSHEVLEEIHAGLEQNSDKSKIVGEPSEPQDTTEPDDAEIHIVPEEGNDNFRQKLISRVEELRVAGKMTKQEFVTLIGPPAATSWEAFVAADASDAWNHVSTKMFERIAQVFGIGSAELLRFKP